MNRAFPVLFLIFIFSLTSGQGYGQDFLHVKGQSIVDGKGEKVLLRGMGLGGWLLQEGYMFRLSGIGQQYRIREKIVEVAGEEKTELFYQKWLENHTTKADIDMLAAWGFNSIRLPLHFQLFTLPVEREPVPGENSWLNKGFELTDSVLRWCSENKIYLILDMHATPGGQGHDLPISDRDPSRPSLWQSEDNRKKLVALWQKIAERYQGEKWLGGYDIINEPNWGFEDSTDKRGIKESKNQPLRELMMDITAAIRRSDNNHIIFIEGNGFGNNYKGILPAWDHNMVLSFHKYGNFNNAQSIKNFIQLREQYNIPLWLGESGENSNTWFTEAIELAESNDIGWAWWQEKKMGINNPMEIKAPKNYQKLLDHWSGKGQNLSRDEAWTILLDLLEMLKIQNNIPHPDVVDAMFRQVRTKEAIPFKNLVLNGTLRIPAVDFDLGRQGVAYYDRDTASYQYTPGVNTRGNRGNRYRNDGVDIDEDTTGPFVFHIEDGEWLQYSIHVKKAGNYRIGFDLLPGDKEGIVSVALNGSEVIRDLPVLNPTVAMPEKIRFRKGLNRLVIKASRGGFRLRSIQISNLNN